MGVGCASSCSSSVQAAFAQRVYELTGAVCDWISPPSAPVGGVDVYAPPSPSPEPSPSPSPESLACYATCAHEPTSCWEFMEMAAGCASSCPESTLASFAHLLCSGTVVGSPSPEPTPLVVSCDCSCYPPNSHGAAAYYCGPGSIDPRCDHGGSCDLSFAYCYDGGNAHDNYGCDFHGDEAGPCCAAPLPSPSPEPSESPPPWSSACGASWLASGMWYVLGASGSASCGVCGEPVFDYAECVAAAAVGVGVLGIGPLDGVHGWAGPAGCHVQEGSNFQFNSEFAGFGVLGHTPVCRAAAPPLASPSPAGASPSPAPAPPCPHPLP